MILQGNGLQCSVISASKYSLTWKSALLYGRGQYSVTLQIIVSISRGELLYQNDEDVHLKFENYPLMETNPGVVRAILEPHIKRST